MAHPIILSDTDAVEAKHTFRYWLNKEQVTLLLVLGSDPISKMAFSKAEELINSKDVDYKSVKVVFVAQPCFILDELKKLPINPRLKKVSWNQLENYVMLSISNNYNNLAFIVSKAKFANQPRGYVNRAIRKAQTIDSKVFA